MNTLHLTLPLYAENAVVTIDDKRVVQKRANGVLSVEHSTESSSVNLKICSLPHELNEKYWWLWAFFYYVISVCGIFNTFIKREYYSYEFECAVPLNGDTNLALIMGSKGDGTKAFEVKSGVVSDEQINKFSFDKTIKRKTWILRIAKIASWIAIVAIVVLVTII